jgi:hypothetical protein
VSSRAPTSNLAGNPKARALLLPLVRLLARQAARESLDPNLGAGANAAVIDTGPNAEPHHKL